MILPYILQKQSNLYLPKKVIKFSNKNVKTVVFKVIQVILSDCK